MPTARPGPWLDQAVERGLIAADEGEVRAPAPPRAPASEGRKPPALVAPLFTPPGCWVLPIATASEANGREWRPRSTRTQAARRAVSAHLGRALVWAAAFAAHYHAGGALRVAITRLGGHRLDRSNLPAALKATEDAVALVLGADDGDPRWRPSWDQEPGGPVGVRVELAAEGGARA